MSEYRERLQMMMLGARVPRARSRARDARPGDRFYAVCEYAAYALFLAGWALCIVCHI